MISAMRRLGRAFLRAPWARRVAALTVTLGLLGGNSMLVATTVFAAAPTTPVTSGGLGDLLHLGFDPGETEDVIDTLPQQVCQIVPALCRQGTTVFEIPAGVGTLGSAPQHLPGDPRGHVTIPSTGCLLGLIGCGQPTPKPKASAAPTVRPSVQAATATTPAPVSTPAAPTPSAAASGCLLGILGNCPTAVTNTCTQGASGCQATASPTPAPNSNALCVLTCGLLQLGGSSCVATVLTTCVLGPTAPSGAGSAGSSPGACVGTVLCLLGSSCTASVGSTCLLGALLPGLPIIGSGSPQPTAPGQSSGSGTGTVPGSGTNDPSTGSPVGTSFGAGGGSPVTSSIIPPQSAGPGSGPSGINLQQPRRDETVGLVSGLSFGHGLILWPLFGLLDLAALAGLVVVVRRRWTATTN